MGVLQVVEGSNGTEPRSQSASRPSSDRTSLSVATEFLNAALRSWDEEHFRAKSQVKVAVAMLRGVAEGHACEALLPRSAPCARGLAPWQVRTIKEFIDASLESRIRLSDCASKARLSNTHFSHAFNRTFGITVSRYVRCRRIERAKHLMLTSRDPLSQIALQCGFADQAQYCRAFRDVVGISPKVWRRQNS